jgi:hypothetical protein
MSEEVANSSGRRHGKYQPANGQATTRVDVREGRNDVSFVEGASWLVNDKCRKVGTNSKGRRSQFNGDCILTNSQTPTRIGVRLDEIDVSLDDGEFV